MTVLDTIDHVAGAGYAMQLLFMGEKFSTTNCFFLAFAVFIELRVENYEKYL